MIPWPNHCSFHRRNHHADIAAGIWRLASNGVQFFAGPFALTICWRAR